MYKGNLTKEEALTAMRDGFKVGREYFSRDEYIYMDKTGSIMSEDGYNFEDWWRNIEPTFSKAKDGKDWIIWKEVEL